VQLNISIEEAQVIEELLDQSFRELLEDATTESDPEKRRHLQRREIVIKGILGKIQAAAM
jgi:hypothetical protein